MSACACLYCTECNAGSHTHTCIQCLVVGPGDQFIYMQWKRNRELEEGIKQKGKERKRGSSRELWRKPSGTSKFLCCSQGQTRPIYYLDGSVGVCFFVDFVCQYLKWFPETLPSLVTDCFSSRVKK